MDRRIAVIASIGVAAIALAVLTLRPTPDPVPAVAPVVVAAPVPAVAPVPAPVPDDNPWSHRAPEVPDRPVAEDEGTWEERRDEQHDAWRERSLDAVRELAAAWTPAERDAVLAATEALVDRIGAGRDDVEAGAINAQQLRVDAAHARGEADEAFRTAVGDRATEVWSALNRASAPE
jgi:hypothetical protein